MADVSFDRRAILINGKRKLLLSGAVHYPRSTPQMWPGIFARCRRSGLTAIETYVFWNLHEAVRGEYDFTGRLNLQRFCREAQEAGLDVVLRIGPYVCAETNYGGLPSWLRDVPGIQLRTENAPFQKEMGRFVTDLCERLRPLFAPAGGPIILAQVENEYSNIAPRYGEAGKRYLDWSVELGRSLNMGVPWIMCLGAAEGAIETINGFYAHELIKDHFQRNPAQPALWTEAYPGWYDTWGFAAHHRTAEDLAFAAAEFFAAGGTGINYYMWHGGSNFGRETMYLQTTAYFPCAPFDEFGRETTTSRHLAHLHQLLIAHADTLLSQDSAVVESLDANCTARTYGKDARKITFLSNTSQAPGTAEFAGKKWSLAPQSVQLVDSKATVLFDTARIAIDDQIHRSIESEPVTLKPAGQWSEPLPSHRKDNAVRGESPIEQLSLTHDQSDYCWYSTTIPGGTGELVLNRVADFVRIFVDSQPVAISAMPLVENRALASGKGFVQAFSLDLPAGKSHRLDILCCALGLIKGDWMLDANMVEEKKGLFGPVTWCGKTVGDWEHRPMLVGETQPAPFSNATATGPTWWRFHFDRPEGSAPLVVDLSSMDKGLAWLNDRCIGRYWLTPGTGRNPISPGEPVQVETSTGPTQRLYHLPLEWLVDRNELILFDESGVDPGRVVLRRIK